ncbi:dr1-associated corepressor-like isoform X2 [Sinocyclocheilus rhinocerous]|uniref:dr1-associated corepressor-like isoform X2 n=1 Tax=Sinocyclocheilus rhinocerous TaxID=307959 RepID=UPI0007B7F4E7|nr:PREDICTED: dr1-associated corepressor-like isoform X2 [Sinocyclocheilus rhinocerous]
MPISVAATAGVLIASAAALRESAALSFRFSEFDRGLTEPRGMPSKKKKYNARFPPARIKKIMQTDEEIGKVAAAVPVIISRALELFLESLLTKACHVTQSRNAKTMTTSHLKQCIELEQQFDFLKDLVAAVPDMQGEGEENHTEGEKIPRRGRKPGSGRKNGGAGAKGKDKRLSGTESEQEDDSEDSETDGEEDEDASRTSTNTQPAAFFHSPDAAALQFVPMGSQQVAPVSSLMALPPAPQKNEDDDEDYDS